MKSDKQIYRISFLSHKQKESVEIDLGSLEANIPLYHFEEGRYTVAVYREDMIIAFDIVREKPISLPKDAVPDLEKSILLSSLPEEDLYKRNLKPRPKRDKDTVVAFKLDKEKREAESAKNTIAYNDREKVDNKKEIEKKEVKYNLSNINRDKSNEQSREEYRRTHLRPNGIKYDEAIKEEKKKN